MQLWRLRKRTSVFPGLSYQVMASVLSGRLVPLLVSFTAEKLSVSAIYPAHRIAPTNLTTFIKGCREYFLEHPLVPIEEWAIPIGSDGRSR